jgi:hypothetical protein
MRWRNKRYDTKKRITRGIKMSCKHKLELYLNGIYNIEVIEVHYWRYCNILTEAVKDVKLRHYSKQILKESYDNIRPVWETV